MAKLDDRPDTFISGISAIFFSFVKNSKIPMMTFLGLLESWRKLIQKHKKGILLVVFTVGFVTYLIFGAILFLIIEGPQEIDAFKKILDVKSKVMTKYPNIPGEAIDEMLHQLSSVGVKGIIMGNTTLKWTLGNAMLFSATLLTTIGYGHLSPTTAPGKLVCMTYTAIGIPLTLLLMATYAERLMTLSEIYKAVLFRRLGRHMRSQAIRTLHVSTIMSMIITGCFLVPAYIFTAFEISWSYLDALYFCFISLTTVGLGDFVPGLDVGHPHIDLYRFGATLYVLAGVTIMMFMMALTGEFLHNFHSPYTEIIQEEMPKEFTPIMPAACLHSYGTIAVHQATIKDKHDTLEP